jgi:hypothetical protein
MGNTVIEKVSGQLPGTFSFFGISCHLVRSSGAWARFVAQSV